MNAFYSVVISLLIQGSFHDAGFSRIHQLAAVANAIRESSLDPNAIGDQGRSVGLFQLNMDTGLGRGRTVAQLQNPRINLQIIINFAKNTPKFVNATTLDQAVSAFTRYIERPANMHREVHIRQRIANNLPR